MTDIPWSQLTQLGLGGTFAVVILWITFRFLGNRKNGTEKILLHMDKSECKMAMAVESIARAIDNQTSLLGKMNEKQSTHYADLIKEINHGSTRRRISEMPEGTK